MEWARTNQHRGFICSWPQLGGPGGLLLANLAVLFFSWLSGDQFLVWGWRIPFLLSIVMVAVGLYIRLGILETPAFQRLLAEKRIERVPVWEVIKRQPKEIILSALARTGEQAPAYITLAFIFTTSSRCCISRPTSCSVRWSPWVYCRSSRSRCPGICRIGSDASACI